MNSHLLAIGIASVVLSGLIPGSAAGADVPPGLTISQTDVGEVFADGNGMTLYMTPAEVVRAGTQCTDAKHLTGVGGVARREYGLIRQEDRPSCLGKNPPAVAAERAVPQGDWDIVALDNGIRQWTYEGRPLYRSTKDMVRGDVNGMWEPAFVPMQLVPAVRIRRSDSGLFLETRGGMSLYTHARDGRGRSQCEDVCAKTWPPLLAGDLAAPAGKNWTIINRKDGSKQWAFRGAPLYTYVNDAGIGHRKGEGKRDWQLARVSDGPKLPPEVSVRRTWLNDVYTDGRGHTIYYYGCRDMSPNALACDDPEDRSHEWFSFCGTADRCAAMFRPIVAPPQAKASGRTWSVVTIPKSWAPVREAQGGADSIRVWAYKGRPLFTFSGDDQPSKFNAIGLAPATYEWFAFGPNGPADLLAPD